MSTEPTRPRVVFHFSLTCSQEGAWGVLSHKKMENTKIFKARRHTINRAHHVRGGHPQRPRVKTRTQPSSRTLTATAFKTQQSKLRALRAPHSKFHVPKTWYDTKIFLSCGLFCRLDWPLPLPPLLPLPRLLSISLVSVSVCDLDMVCVETSWTFLRTACAAALSKKFRVLRAHFDPRTAPITDPLAFSAPDWCGRR